MADVAVAFEQRATQAEAMVQQLDAHLAVLRKHAGITHDRDKNEKRKEEIVLIPDSGEGWAVCSLCLSVPCGQAEATRRGERGREKERRG
jgi:hypothetical protein